jgi:hypothetical protein
MDKVWIVYEECMRSMSGSPAQTLLYLTIRSDDDI